MPNTYPNLYSVIALEKNLLQDSAGKIITNPNPSRGCEAAEAWIRICDYITCRVLKQIFFQIYN